MKQPYPPSRLGPEPPSQSPEGKAASIGGGFRPEIRRPRGELGRDRARGTRTARTALAGGRRGAMLFHGRSGCHPPRRLRPKRAGAS